MIKKLFGETEEEQFRYLKTRFIALGVGIAFFLIGFLLQIFGVEFSSIFYGLAEIILVVVLLMFGWAILKSLFGVATIGALFSNNIVFGLVIFVIYIYLLDILEA